jgi:ferredoxin
MIHPIVLSYIQPAIKLLNPYFERKEPMTYVIVKDDCIQCGACESECPEGAISEVDGYYEIDSVKCKDCGSCSDVCPTSSINPA